MKALLISANTESINMLIVPAGLAAVATAAERAGHDVKFLDLMGEGDPAARIEAAFADFDPDVVGLSVRNIDDQSYNRRRFLLDPARDVVASCRAASEAAIVLGGAGYSIFPEAALDYLGADMGIVGEGEAAFVKLLDELGKGQDPAEVPGVCLPGRGVAAPPEVAPDLDALPVPDPRLFSYLSPPPDSLWMPFQTRRGCPMDCSYCSTCSIEGRSTRKRSVDKVADAIDDYRAQGFNRFFFTDNTFNLPRSYALELCVALAERCPGVRWRAIAYPKGLDGELANAMAEGGCVEASLGFESGDDRMLSVLNKRFDAREAREAASALGDAGIRRMGFVLLGGPGETMESARRSLEYADSLGLEAMRVTVGIRIYPNTELARQAFERGAIAPDQDPLFPAYYLETKIAEELLETAREWAEARPGWFI